jgi:hypothetical protein
MSYNQKIFLDQVSELANLDSILDEHLYSATVSKNTSKTNQSKLLDCIYKAYKQSMMEGIQNAYFVSMKANETTDISCMSQFAFLLQYAKCEGPVKRLNSFVQVQHCIV